MVQAYILVRVYELKVTTTKLGSNKTMTISPPGIIKAVKNGNEQGQ
jgi:hypothetical protein